MVFRNETDYRFLFSIVARVSVAKLLWGGLEIVCQLIFEFELNGR